MMHGVSSMPDYYAVNAFFNFSAYCLGDFDPLFGTHVFAEDSI